VIRGNSLSYGYRILVMFGYGGRRRGLGFSAARDLVIDRNTIDHSAVGIGLDENIGSVLIKDNGFNADAARFELGDMSKCLLMANP
jgi:hypothetical protein